MISLDTSVYIVYKAGHISYVPDLTTYLTKKQEKVLRTIENIISDTGKSPTIKELQDKLNLKYKRSVVQYLEALERKGFILRSSRTRGIKLEQNNYSQEFLSVPILGYANAGEPLVPAEEEKLGTLKIEKKLIPGRRRLFSLIAKGDSMNEYILKDISIESNVFLVISKDAEIHDGDAVLAIIDNCATVKCIKRSKNLIILYPRSRNPIHKPIYIRDNSEGLISGKIVAVLENPEIQ